MPLGWTFAGIIRDRRSTKIAKRIVVRWRLTFYGKVKFASLCICMGKTFENLLLQNRACLMAESLRISLGTGGLPKMLKYWSYIDIWPFYGKVNFASLCICMGKNVQNFKQLLLWSLWTNFAQISYGASLGRGNKRLLKWSQFVDQDGHHAHLW